MIGKIEFVIWQKVYSGYFCLAANYSAEHEICISSGRVKRWDWLLRKNSKIRSTMLRIAASGPLHRFSNEFAGEHTQLDFVSACMI